MFRQLAAALVQQVPPLTPLEAANAVLTHSRPSQYADFLEEYWRVGRTPARYLGRLANPAHIDMARDLETDAGMPIVPGPPPPEPPSWHHLVYAYMLENTRIVEIFRRVVYEYTHGERLPPPRQATQRWLHATEQLFFAEPLAYSVRAVTSRLRPDSGAVRRNAYYRMLGMDLNHGTDDARPYPYVKADAANRDFSSLFESLLVEVWRGYANRLNFGNENHTDDDAIRTLVRRIREMLQSRRQTGTLSREEFDAVATLSWFHLTVELNTDVVEDLAVDSGGTADRLKMIGERVGLPAHARSDSYLQLATNMSAILIAIESGAVEAAGPESLYEDPALQEAMLQIITHWSIATGRNVKDPTLRQPLGAVLVAPSVGTPAGGNGVPVNRIPVPLR
jgi:hypothetical protein